MPWDSESLQDEIAGEFASVQEIAGVGTRPTEGMRTFRLKPRCTLPAPTLDRARWVRAEVQSAHQKKVILLKAGHRPGQWTEGWRKAAAEAGVVPPEQDASDTARRARLAEVALLAGKRPARWGRTWVAAAKKLGIPVPAAAAARR